MEVKIDGKVYKAFPGEKIIDVFLREGIFIPNLCYEKDLENVGSCGLCLVKVKGEGIVKACEREVEDGMEIFSEEEKVIELRRSAFLFLLKATSHPTYCLFCEKYSECKSIHDCLKGLKLEKGCKACAKDGDCKIQEIAEKLGIKEGIRKEGRGLKKIEEPLFVRDYDYCILCSKCIRVCYERRSQNSCIGYITKEDGEPISLLETDCKFCGSCVDICPTGALYCPDEEKPERWEETVCPFCGVGCRIEAGIKDGRIVKVRGKRERSVNRGELCVKGRFSVDFVQKEERLRSPLLKKGDTFVPISWDDAIRIICKEFEKYMGKTAVIGSAKCTNEENYLIQKFARIVLKTNNVDHCARLCHSPTAHALSKSLGYSAMTNPIEDILNSKTIILIGSNPTENHPIVELYIKEAKKRGANLVVINPLCIELCKIADVWISIKPGTDISFLCAMAKVIIEEGIEDRSFMESYTEGYADFIEYARSFDLERLSEICGVKIHEIKEVAHLYARQKPSAIIYAMGITQHLNGTQNVYAISNLSLLTGNLGKEGSGILPLRGQNNVQGACDMGVLPDLLPGYKSLDEKEIFESVWKGEIPSEKGLTLIEMFEGAISGRIRAMYIIGENPVISNPDVSKTKEALNRLDFLVVQDIFVTDTARFADIILPAASFAEKEGTFTNTERRVQRIKRLIDPIGKPDWQIICMIAKGMGRYDFSYRSSEEIFEEIRKVVPYYRGITYRRLEKEVLFWPCESEDKPGEKILYRRGFPKGKAVFFKVDPIPKDPSSDKEYPFVLITGRSLYHYHTRTMTQKMDRLCKPEIEVNREDFKEGLPDEITVESKRGRIKGRVKISERVPKGVIFSTFHFSEIPVNSLLGLKVDPDSKIPHFKKIPVKVNFPCFFQKK